MEIERQVPGERKNEYKDLHPLSPVEDVIEGRMARRKVARGYNKSSDSHRTAGNEGGNRPSKIVTGRETPGMSAHNKSQAEDLPAWKLKLQGLDINNTDKKKRK